MWRKTARILTLPKLLHNPTGILEFDPKMNDEPLWRTALTADTSW
jgi:hypothetical protein